MLFNSFNFLIFLPVVFFAYWFVFKRNIDIQNVFVLIASYFFYASWDWRFLSIIIISTAVDFGIGLSLQAEESSLKRKLLVALSLAVNLGFLGFFKYCNFFIDSFNESFAFIGINFEPRTLNIILPVGISFYTFQTLSYTLDVYRKQLEPTQNFVAFAAYVSFFPQLVAGPIERAKDLLPQFLKERKFEYSEATNGMRQILLGFFKKLVIADACAPYVDQVFSNNENLSGTTLAVGAFLFTFQLYADFSGYSDIAIGTARLFGFNLAKNFSVPYFSTSTTEFWRRWHITLGTWANLYVFRPLAMKQTARYGNKGIVFSLILTFTLIGLWHGANYTFILFGLIHGIVLSIEFLTKKGRKKWRKVLRDELFLAGGWFTTMTIWTLTCVIFRAENMNHALSYINRMVSPSVIAIPSVFPLRLFVTIFVFLMLEFANRQKEHTFDVKNWPKSFRWAFYLLICFLIMSLGELSQDRFIYFQF